LLPIFLGELLKSLSALVAIKIRSTASSQASKNRGEIGKTSVVVLLVLSLQECVHLVMEKI